MKTDVSRKAFLTVWKNLETFLRDLSQLPSSEFVLLDETGRSFALSTGSPFASENWVFWPGPVTEERAVNEAERFFRRKNEPYIWPLYPCKKAPSSALLKKAGLSERGCLLAMDCPAVSGPHEGPLTFRDVLEEDEAALWAVLSWQGFGGGGEPPASLRAMAAAAAGLQSFRLVMAFLEGRPLGSFLTILTDLDLGIYYFSVLPELRRRGGARRMMEEISRFARERGKDTLVLQATPSGVPFYRNFGFRSLGKIPLYSAEDDVF